MIRAVHDHGVDHPDLTAHNVLLDDAGNTFLVDFDNARDQAARQNGSASGIERFNRSLRKVALETGTEFDAAAWREVEAGYAGRVVPRVSGSARLQQVANLREQLFLGRRSRAAPAAAPLPACSSAC